jgi:hypothetical protein
LGFRSFFFERRKGKFFVELARLIVLLFHVGLAQLFAGVVLSVVSLGFRIFFFERWQRKGKRGVELARFKIFCWTPGLRTFFSICCRFLFERGRGKVFLLS